METSPPTRGDLYAYGTIAAIAFWCSNHACLRHDSVSGGVVVIDYGRDDFAGHGAPSYCLECYGPVQVRPAWKAMSKSLIG